MSSGVLQCHLSTHLISLDGARWNQVLERLFKALLLLPSCRGHHALFEAWFLLVQCAHWVQVAVQLLVTSGPEDGGALLWLLTFYHHPTNRGHHRALQQVRAFLAAIIL